MKDINAISKCTVQPGSVTQRAKVIYSTEWDPTPRTLFEFYDDELTFTSNEFIGLTVEEGQALFTKKDIAYLQS